MKIFLTTILLFLHSSIAFASNLKPYLGLDLGIKKISFAKGYGKNIFPSRITSYDGKIGVFVTSKLAVEFIYGRNVSSKKSTYSDEHSFLGQTVSVAGPKDENRTLGKSEHIAKIRQNNKVVKLKFYPIEYNKYPISLFLGVGAGIQNNLIKVNSKLTFNQTVDGETTSFNTNMICENRDSSKYLILEGGLSYKISDRASIELSAHYEHNMRNELEFGYIASAGISEFTIKQSPLKVKLKSNGFGGKISLRYML